MELSKEFRVNVAKALLVKRETFTGSDAAFAKQYELNGAIFSRIRNGETEKVVNDSKWLRIARALDVSVNDRKWQVARTKVFATIEEDIDFCQTYSKSKMFVDDCGIGKTFTAKYLSRTRKNCFYIDASQCKTRHLFTRALARLIGVDSNGKLADVKEDIKYYLNSLPTPIIIIDEAGDLDSKAFLDLKEYWNATEHGCGWYLMGAEGLRAMIERGVRGKKVGFAEVFSRFSEKYTSVVPVVPEEKQDFFKQLISDVLRANCDSLELIKRVMMQALVRNANGNVGGLRRAESLLILHSNG